jgi:ATPase
LVRPDYVIYDEVRKTSDFEVFADMRLAGVGLIGVTHANRAIDAVQRLIGRVELGMIPQVVDTVIHILKGQIQQILELEFSVRVPSGMTEADLARPVILVRDFLTKQEVYEIYTYGEQVVVMPIQGGDGHATGVNKLAEEQLLHLLRRHVRGDVQVEVVGSQKAKVYVEEWEIPALIGKGGVTIQAIEKEVGLGLDVNPLTKKKGARRSKQWQEMVPAVHRSKNTIVLVLEPELADREAEVLVDGEPLLVGTVPRKGEIRVKKDSDVGRDILRAHAEGKNLVVRL